MRFSKAAIQHTCYFKLFVSVCLLCSLTNIRAQVKYVTDPAYLQTKTLQDPVFQNRSLDTNISNFQNYYFRNTNGHFGVPSAPLLFNYNKQALGFRLYDLPYNNDIIKDEQVPFYKTKGPYASLTGIAGSKQEQWFKLLFSYTFKNNMNLTLGFNRYLGIGFYNLQKSFTNNFYVSTNYSSDDKRFGYNAYFLLNKLKHQENGGIKNDSLFASTPQKDILPVNISSAHRENRTMTVYANPWYRLNKQEDSSTVLSHFVDYEFRYEGDYNKYVDLNNGPDSFYVWHYLNPLSTNDSTHLRQVANQINYTVRLNPLDLALKLGYKSEYTVLHQNGNSDFRNNSVLANISLNKTYYRANIAGAYIFNGSNQSDYQIDMTNKIAYPIFKKLKDPLVFSLSLLAEQRHPNYLYNNWYSNNFMWSNQFVPTQTQQAMLNITSKKLRLTIGAYVQNVKNYLYFDYLAMPQQYSDNIQNMSVYIKKDLLIARHLGFDNYICYQRTSDTNIVRIPQLDIRSSLYYQASLFKNNLWLQVGFQGEYYSRFTGYGYMPATNSYFLERNNPAANLATNNSYYLQSNKGAGNYPYIDFFITARIKPVKFFVKIDHVFQGLLGTNYSLAANYFQPDRAFKFGLNWVFFD